MRRCALTLVAALLAAVSIGFSASGGKAAEKPGVADALTRTAHVHSLHYAVQIGINENGMPLALQIRGQADAHTISVHFASQGSSGGELVYGPFLYEHAPDGVAVKVRWLRTSLSRLSPKSRALVTLRALKIAPLLQLAGRGHLEGDAKGRVFRGPVAYDDPVVRSSLSHLTDGIEFRELRLTVDVHNGLIDRLLLTGKTADGSSTLSLAAHLYAFNRPLRVVPPKPGTFTDVELEQLSE
jgi:hypothetical protein